MRLRQRTLKHTGGISSFSGPVFFSGFAVRFVKTPPFSMPPPYTRFEFPAVAGARIGSSDGVLLDGVC